jgi:hypothetical protein
MIRATSVTSRLVAYPPFKAASVAHLESHHDGAGARERFLRSGAASSVTAPLQAERQRPQDEQCPTRSGRIIPDDLLLVVASLARLSLRLRGRAQATETMEADLATRAGVSCSTRVKLSLRVADSDSRAAGSELATVTGAGGLFVRTR